MGLRWVISLTSQSRNNASSSVLNRLPERAEKDVRLPRIFTAVIQRRGTNSSLTTVRTASASRPNALRKITDCTPGGTASATLVSSSSHHREFSRADCIEDFDCRRFPNSTQASSKKAAIKPKTFDLVVAEACRLVLVKRVCNFCCKCNRSVFSADTR